jgi:hypothetical protein
MTKEYDFQYFEGSSFSDLFADDIKDARYAFILNYPATAAWAAYPNTKKYYIQDGNDEATKVAYDKICQKEPWKNLAVLGDAIAALVVRPPRNTLVDYWRERFGFKYDNIEVMQRATYLDYLNQSNKFQKIITLFPFDHLRPEKHAVDPDEHYKLLSKVSLAEMGVHYPRYHTYHLSETPLDDVEVPDEFPYLIKTAHGLSGEGTYIIKDENDFKYCFKQLEKYVKINLVDAIVVSEFVDSVVQNYCVQFYVGKSGDIKLIGATSQLVSDEGEFLGGIIDYRDTDMSKFFHKIAAIGRFAHKHGYFGCIGFDVLEDTDGQLHLIDANFRVNGSTPLCLQRHTLLERGKVVAKYSGDYRMDGTLDSILETLKPELDNLDFTIFSALEKVNYGNIYCEILGVVAGENLEDMQAVEETLTEKGLQQG